MGQSAAVCPAFFPGRAIGTVAEPDIVEASGLSASRKNSDLLWVHNDSGNTAALYAIASDGTPLATYLPTGTSNIDWVFTMA